MPGAAPKTTPTTHKRTASAASGGDQPPESGTGAEGTIEELIDVEAATEAINAAADLELQQALETMRRVEAEELLSARSTPRDAPCSHTDLASTFRDVELRLDEDLRGRYDQPGAQWGDLLEPPQERTELCDGVARHDTSMGRHNLSMIGDMPIAQGVRRVGGAASPSPEPHSGAKPSGARRHAQGVRDAPSADQAARRRGSPRAPKGNDEGLSPESAPNKIPRSLKGRAKGPSKAEWRADANSLLDIAGLRPCQRAKPSQQADGGSDGPRRWRGPHRRARQATISA